MTERERREEEDRFTRSLAGLAVTLLLAVIGLWLADALAANRSSRIACCRVA